MACLPGSESRLLQEFAKPIANDLAILGAELAGLTKPLQNDVLLLVEFHFHDVGLATRVLGLHLGGLLSRPAPAAPRPRRHALGTVWGRRFMRWTQYRSDTRHHVAAPRGILRCPTRRIVL